MIFSSPSLTFSIAVIGLRCFATSLLNSSLFVFMGTMFLFIEAVLGRTSFFLPTDFLILDEKILFFEGNVSFLRNLLS